MVEDILGQRKYYIMFKSGFPAAFNPYLMQGAD